MVAEMVLVFGSASQLSKKRKQNKERRNVSFEDVF